MARIEKEQRKRRNVSPFGAILQKRVPARVPVPETERSRLQIGLGLEKIGAAGASVAPRRRVFNSSLYLF